VVACARRPCWIGRSQGGLQRRPTASSLRHLLPGSFHPPRRERQQAEAMKNALSLRVLSQRGRNTGGLAVCEREA